MGPTRPDGNGLPVVGIYHGSPDFFLPLVRELVPDSQLRVCTRWDGIGDIADEVEVLLAFKFGFRPFPREQILGMPRLRWVQLGSAGIDHIAPFDPARLIVTNASGIHGDVMSEYVIGMLIHMTWNVARLVDQQRARQWQRYEVPALAGRTMGIVGTGRVGQAIAARARAFGMRTIGVRRSGAPLDGFEAMYRPEALRDLVAASDVVVVALPLTHETRGSFGAGELAALRPAAYFVNVSRGGIVDEPALIELLERRRIAGAVLDVFDREPLPPESPFWTLPNVAVTPHIAGELEGWPLELTRLFCANLRRWMKEEPLRNVVDPTAGY